MGCEGSEVYVLEGITWVNWKVPPGGGGLRGLCGTGLREDNLGKLEGSPVGGGL